MARSTHTANFYGKRLTAATEYIYNNLANPLSIPDIAEKAAFSPSHFRKVFIQWIGETPQDYLRRCRLERAAALIRYGADLKIREVAEQCGYKSPEAFNRAFQTYFGMPPMEWRAGGYSKWNAESVDSPDDSVNIENNQVEVINIPRFRVIYQRKVGPYTEGEADLWSRLAQLAGSLNLGNQECYGIGVDDPSVTPRARCRFDACIKLPPLLALPHHVPVKTIAGGYYAVLNYAGPAGGTKRHWDWLCRFWLPEGGYKISHNFCFERYPHGFPRMGMDVQSQLYLPLRK